MPYRQKGAEWLANPAPRVVENDTCCVSYHLATRGFHKFLGVGIVPAETGQFKLNARGQMPSCRRRDAPMVAWPCCSTLPQSERTGRSCSRSHVPSRLTGRRIPYCALPSRISHGPTVPPVRRHASPGDRRSFWRALHPLPSRRARFAQRA